MAEVRVTLAPNISNVTHELHYGGGIGIGGDYASVILWINDLTLKIYGTPEDMDRALRDLTDAWREREEKIEGDYREFLDTVNEDDDGPVSLDD